MGMGLTLYGIPNCDTVKRARAWLAARGVAHEFHDFRRAGVPGAELDHWLAALGWDALLNRRGTTWRQLDADTQAAVVDSNSARALMQQHSSVIKRPVVRWPDGGLTVGFEEQAWAARLAAQV